MKRVLIVNVNWMGDVLFSTPFIRAIKAGFPGGYIACMVVPRCREILEGNPHLDEIIIYDEEGIHRNLKGKIHFVSHLRSKRFDGAFLLHRSFTRTLLVALSGISERVGYPTRKRGFLLTEKVNLPDAQIHRVEYFLNIARAAGIQVGDNEGYDFFISHEDKKHIRELLEREGISERDSLVVINPGGNWLLKRWPKENFACVADQLTEVFNCRIAITGSEKDIGLAEDISALMKSKPIITCGKTSLKQLGALLERSLLVISNDSGPMHIAVSQKTKAIALFGPTSPTITGPYGKGDYTVIQKDIGCEVPCYNLTCPDNECMKAISVEDVVDASKKILHFE